MNFFLFLCLYISINSYYIFRLPFKSIIPHITNISPEEFAKLFYESNYYLDITIGSNYQKIPMRLSFANYHSFLTNANYSKNFITFNPDKSITYHKMTFGPRHFSFININQGICSTETFTLKQFDDKEKEISCENIDFILATRPAFNISGDFGMKLYTKPSDYNNLTYFNFIVNLYKRKYIKYQIFTINFFNKNEGEIIIGDSPDKYSTWDEDTYIHNNVIANKTGYFWGFSNLVSFLNKKRLNIKAEQAEFKIESNLIEPISSYVEKLNELFFEEQKNKNKCILEESSGNFTFYHCDKDINLTNFPTLQIYQDMLNYTFELNSDDLFEDIGDRKYFLVNFAIVSETKWVLGRPFLVKYNFTYDISARTVGMFFGKKELEPKDNNTDKNNHKFNKVWIYVIIACIIIFILSVVIFYLIKKIPRKKRVNELEENFDYRENKDKNTNHEEENKFGIDI